MGAQTFNDDRLRFLRRRHSARQIHQAVDSLRQTGFRNISIDLMYGFPEETLEDWEADIKEALSLDVEHISTYCLMYEEGTPLYQLLEQGKVSEIDEELERQMYDTLIDRLEAVVPTAETSPGKVRYLVMFIANSFQTIYQRVIHLPFQFLIYLRHLTLFQ